MRLLIAIISLALMLSPALARPFDYSFYLGPEYWSINSAKGTTTSQLVTAGFAMRANLFDQLNLEFRGGSGEISNTEASFSETSLLYGLIKDPKAFLGLGISHLSYNNVVDKTSGTTIYEQLQAAKVQWEQSLSNFSSLYVKALTGLAGGYEVGWLGYWDADMGDFNLILGYKDIQLGNQNNMQGAFIGSNIYF